MAQGLPIKQIKFVASIRIAGPNDDRLSNGVDTLYDQRPAYQGLFLTNYPKLLLAELCSCFLTGG
ncbi:hypothetical protein [Hymenobacter cellulosivorans]|uniref:Uncharacterized protein n=1 Tax=Hymenobacter cellulosivorans TaxID=2932249 RepID=A0ABY4F5B0_9BACT|nr:hypothetical protein [Hymenobacter cellulosivorans]UOQ51831.1 hypothetical protein MUN80_18960 [Hymenobacter cellulosivorans]